MKDVVSKSRYSSSVDFTFNNLESGCTESKIPGIKYGCLMEIIVVYAILNAFRLLLIQALFMFADNKGYP
jgi:hypothetical protein